ncbi:MAG: hypothetical protein EHM68_13670, partial [Lysobacterales bacterium]
MKHGFGKTSGRLPARQRGAFTMFTAILVLILLTEMIIYAVHVGVFEQRKSSNEMRQKEAFHIADSAIQFGKEFLLANSTDVSSGGAGGWLNDRWQECPDSPEPEHPCSAEPDTLLRGDMYFYAPEDPDLRGEDDVYGNATLPISRSTNTAYQELTDEAQQVSTYALLCMLHIEREAENQTIVPNSIVQGCTTNADLMDTRYYMVTVLARGEADCDGGACTAKALIADKIGSFSPGGGEGGAAVPLTARSTFPPTGTTEIVPNPNGGGVGVPISAWLNANDECPIDPPVDPTGGSWSTCERHEWYGTDIMPDDFKCPTANCTCGNQEKRISYGQGLEQVVGIDIVTDESFPCDLWTYIFGVPKYEVDGVTINDESVDFVKYGLAQEVLDDCSSLDENSSGVYWVSGNLCSVNANTQIGTAEKPVFLISAARTTRFNGGASLFGILMATNVEVPGATFDAVGTMTIYGAAVIDAEMDYRGNFQIVYLENVLEQSLATGGQG